MARTICLPKDQIKLGFIGTKNVGKTTLASLLNASLRYSGVNSDLIHEAALFCPLPLNEGTSIESAYWLFGHQIAHEALYSAKRSFTICDRTIIDVYPFTLHALQKRKQDADEDHSEDMQKLCNLKKLIIDYLNASPYDFLFYVPMHQEYWQPHTLSNNIDFRQAVDETFRAFLSEIKADYYELKALSTRNRLKEVLACIQSKQFSEKILRAS